MRFPLEWTIVLRGAYMCNSVPHAETPHTRPEQQMPPGARTVTWRATSTIPFTPPSHPQIQTQNPPKPTEYFSAANAIGPYICARFLCNLPLGYGPFLLATVIYWMTGTSTHVVSCRVGWRACLSALVCVDSARAEDRFPISIDPTIPHDGPSNQ